jgi:hypothetical protein
MSLCGFNNVIWVLALLAFRFGSCRGVDASSYYNGTER